MVSAGGVLYFGATTSAFGNELWKSDGSAAGTGIVKDLIPGAGNGFVNDSSILTYGGSLGTPLPSGGLFFYATDGVHGFEPWATDGTEPGTTLLGDLAPGTANSVDTNSTPGILGD